MTTPITTLERFKTYAGISTNNQDTLIQQLIPACLSAIGEFCNRVFESKVITGYRDGNSASGMMLSNYPITAISSVVIDGTSIQPSVGQGNGYFYPPKGRRLILRGYKFTQGSRNVVIDYTAGYGDASGPNGSDIAPWPADLELALHMFILIRIRERERLGVGSKALATESVTYTDATSGTSSGSQGIPSAARVILDNYVNTVPETSE